MQHNVATAGGTISGMENANLKGTTKSCSDPGVSECAECFAASARAHVRRAELASLPGTGLGSFIVRAGRTKELTANGTGDVVFDATQLRVRSHGVLRINIGPTTTHVIIRVHGTMRLGRAAEIRVDDPGKVLFLVDGMFFARRSSHVRGTIFGADLVQVGIQTITDGQLLSDKQVKALRSAAVQLKSFQGW